MISVNVIKVLSSSEKKTLFFFKRNKNIKENINKLIMYRMNEHTLMKNFTGLINKGIITKNAKNGNLELKLKRYEAHDIEIDLDKLDFHFDLLKELNGNQIHLLLALYSVGGKRTNEYLADYTNLSISTVKRSLRELCKRKFVIKITDTRLEKDELWKIRFNKKRVLKYEHYRKSNKSFLLLEKLGVNLTKINDMGIIKDLNFVDSSYIYEKKIVTSIINMTEASIRYNFNIHHINTLEEFEELKKRELIMLMAMIAMDSNKSLKELELHYKYFVERHFNSSLSNHEYYVICKEEKRNEEIIKEFGIEHEKVSNIDYFKSLL